MVELEQQPQVVEFDNKPLVEDIVQHQVEEDNMVEEGSNIPEAVVVVLEPGVAVRMQGMVVPVQGVVLVQKALLNQNLNRYSLLVRPLILI